jgi:hypothetical protein
MSVFVIVIVNVIVIVIVFVNVVVIVIVILNCIVIVIVIVIEGIDKKNEPPRLLYRISKQEPVRIYPTNEHNRRNYGCKRIRTGRI